MNEIIHSKGVWNCRNKAKKKDIRALRDGARYLEKKMVIPEFINPNTKDLRYRWSYSEWS